MMTFRNRTQISDFLASVRGSLPMILGICMLFFATQSFASTFEEAGKIESINLVRQTIQVNDENYSLPAEVKLAGSDESAILNLNEGYTVRFHGDLMTGSVRGTIKTITILRKPETSEQD